MIAKRFGTQQGSKLRVIEDCTCGGLNNAFFFWLSAAWVKSRAERPSVSGVNRQLCSANEEKKKKKSEQATACTNRMQIRN